MKLLEFPKNFSDKLKLETLIKEYNALLLYLAKCDIIELEGGEEVNDN